MLPFSVPAIEFYSQSLLIANIPLNRPLDPLNLNIFGVRVSVECADKSANFLIKTCYSSLLGPLCDNDVYPKFGLFIQTSGAKEGWSLAADGQLCQCPTKADLLYDFEKCLTIQLQRLRQDLFFVHAAVLVAPTGTCLAIVGESGAGKSTLCWGLCNEGFQYMSDELAPIDCSNRSVLPYPRAICIKDVPTGAYALPIESIVTHRTSHIRTEDLPKSPKKTAVPLDLIVFLENGHTKGRSRPERLRKGEAAARLYSHGLNQLAHSNSGLSTASEIVKSVPCFLVARQSPGDLRKIVTDLTIINS